MRIYNRDNYIQADSPLKKDLLKLFKKSDKLTILDIGGCEGEESIRYSRVFPFSAIYIFEPIPENQKLIAENKIRYKVENMVLVPFAVSDEEGFYEFYVSSGHPENQPKDLDWDFGNKSSSLLIPASQINQEWLKFNQKIDVATITLYSFLTENQLKEVDFIHMDVQGAELKVLLGAKHFINKIKTVWMEVSDLEIYRNQPLRFDVERFMKSKGFYLLKSEMQGNFGDQLYLNKKYFSIIFLFFMSAQFLFKKNLVRLKLLVR